MISIKYPKTFHLPWSPNLQNDDRVIGSLDGFEGQEVIVTEKMDGETTSMYNDKIHARSINSKPHPSREWVNTFHRSIKNSIPNHHIIRGENVFAVHSIYYDQLKSYFLVFGIWHNNTILSWDDTIEMCESIGLITVPVIWRGMWDESVINQFKVVPQSEGYVIRRTDKFDGVCFSRYVAKYVRKSHVQTDDHWMYKYIRKNDIIGN